MEVTTRSPPTAVAGTVSPEIQVHDSDTSQFGFMTATVRARPEARARDAELLALRVEPRRAGLARGRQIEDQPASDLGAVARAPLAFAGLALRYQVGELGLGDAAPGDLEPDHEGAALAPAGTAPAAIPRHHGAHLAARTDQRRGGSSASRSRPGARRLRAQRRGDAPGGPRPGWRGLRLGPRLDAGRARPRRRRRPHDARAAADRGHDVAHVARDVRHERGARLLAARYPRQARLPGPGQLGRSQALLRQGLDEPDAHLGRHQVLRVAGHEGPADQRLD